jgi:hypothetical protein
LTGPLARIASLDDGSTIWIDQQGRYHVLDAGLVVKVDPKGTTVIRAEIRRGTDKSSSKESAGKGKNPGERELAFLDAVFEPVDRHLKSLLPADVDIHYSYPYMGIDTWTPENRTVTVQLPDRIELMTASLPCKNTHEGFGVVNIDGVATLILSADQHWWFPAAMIHVDSSRTEMSGEYSPQKDPGPSS